MMRNIHVYFQSRMMVYLFSNEHSSYSVLQPLRRLPVETLKQALRWKSSKNGSIGGFLRRSIAPLGPRSEIQMLYINDS